MMRKKIPTSREISLRDRNQETTIMVTSKSGNTIISKTEDFISINQKIILPENYKKFSTIKLRIKPAKLIFVNKDEDLNNNHNRKDTEKTDFEENETPEPKISPRNFKSESSFLLSSAECLTLMNDEKTHSRKNRTLGTVSCGTNQSRTEAVPFISSEMNGDSEIVKELVLEKFKDMLQGFIERSNRRRIISTEEEEQQGGWADYMHFLDSFTCQRFRDDSRDLWPEYYLKNVEKLKTVDMKEMTCEDDNQYPWHQEYGKQNSLPQEQSSNLENQELPIDLSKKEYLPSYVHISEPLETVQTMQFMESKALTIDNHSIVSDSSDEELQKNTIDYKANGLEEEINEQKIAITQVLKVLSLCQSSKQLSESVLRVEAERVLLVATLRKNILSEEILKPKRRPKEDENGFVLLSKLRIPIEQISEKKRKQSSFFVCVFRCRNTVYCSELLVVNKQMELEIEEPFCFDELPTDFEITVEVYCMQLKIQEKPSTGRRILKKYRNLLLGLRSRYRHQEEGGQKEKELSARISAFTFIGRTAIKRSNLRLREFSFEANSTQAFTLGDLKCTIGSGVKLDVFLSGFLMVCESYGGKTRWRRQWCILDASELKFWDYPGKEETAEPNRRIDLSRSLLPCIMLADRKFCSRPRSLHLKIGPDSPQEEFYHKEIFLAADNPRDFLFWEKELNRVVKNLINWGCMKSYFENSL